MKTALQAAKGLSADDLQLLLQRAQQGRAYVLEVPAHAVLQVSGDAAAVGAAAGGGGGGGSKRNALECFCCKGESVFWFCRC